MDFERFFEDSIDFLCYLTAEGSMLRINRQWHKRLGWSDEVLLGRPLSLIVHPDDIARFSSALKNLHNTSAIQTHENRVVCSNGDNLWVSWNICRLADGTLAATARDINSWMLNRQKLDEQTRFQELAASLANVGYWEHDPGANETRWSRTQYAIYGIEPGDPRLSPEFARSHLHPKDREKIQAQHDSAWAMGNSLEYKARVNRRDGECRHIHTRAYCQAKGENGGSVFFGVTKDITDHERAMLAVKHAALHDSLTNLPNRKNFNDRLAESLSITRRHGRPTVVVLLDLDHFKDVNDTLGHAIGDELLVQMSDRLRAELTEKETVSRLGGDEFAVIQTGEDQPAGAEQLCARIINLLKSPFEIDQHYLAVGCSLGVAIAPDDGDDADTILRNADIALYKAKNDGRGIIRFFQSEMDTRLRARRQLEIELKQAIANHEFELYYQPVFDTESQKLCSLEALIRWHSPTRGLVAPMEFIPLAEETGLIMPIGRWVMHQACQEAASWPSSVRVAVNVSAVEFRGSALVESVTKALSDAHLEPARLEIEITESSLLSDGQKALDILHELRKLGVLIVMDDFGMGYSSLSYLRKFPFDKLKLDSSFVKQSPHEQDDLAIVSAVAEMASALGIESTAEGVETQTHLDVVAGEGYGQVQGFLYSEPRPAQEIFSHYFASADGMPERQETEPQ